MPTCAGSLLAVRKGGRILACEVETPMSPRSRTGARLDLDPPPDQRASLPIERDGARIWFEHFGETTPRLAVHVIFRSPACAC
jgi:hypothetical protein